VASRSARASASGAASAAFDGLAGVVLGAVEPFEALDERGLRFLHPVGRVLEHAGGQQVTAAWLVGDHLRLLLVVVSEQMGRAARAGLPGQE
jgi:hypothetical protein